MQNCVVHGYNAHVAPFAALPSVRTFLLAYQRSQIEVAHQNKFQGLVMEGRDIGSVILPAADFCFFLEADPKTRRERRASEGAQDVIQTRDRLDSGRKTAPLVCPKARGAYRYESVLSNGSGRLHQSTHCWLAQKRCGGGPLIFRLKEF